MGVSSWRGWRFYAVAALAGLLVIYHVMKLQQIYFNQESSLLDNLVHAQSAIRVLIVVALGLVTFRIRHSLILMWIAITALIISQIASHFLDQGREYVQLMTVVGYLRGLIFPSLITLLSSKSVVADERVPNSD